MRITLAGKLSGYVRTYVRTYAYTYVRTGEVRDKRIMEAARGSANGDSSGQPLLGKPALQLRVRTLQPPSFFQTPSSVLSQSTGQLPREDSHVRPESRGGGTAKGHDQDEQSLLRQENQQLR